MNTCIGFAGRECGALFSNPASATPFCSGCELRRTQWIYSDIREAIGLVAMTAWRLRRLAAS